MITQLDVKFDIDPIVKQVIDLGHFEDSVILNETEGKLLSGPYTVKKEFQNTPLGDVLDSLGTIGEARLLKLTSAESYTAHSDPDDRLHLAITTNPYCLLIDLDNERNYHIPVNGNVYLMDTSYIHVASNFGGRDRIHLNIRIPLPAFTSPGYKLGIEGGDFDWKQEAYMVIMTFFNRAIKEKIITGFEKINSKEVLINCEDVSILNPYIEKLKNKGFNVMIEKYNVL